MRPPPWGAAGLICALTTAGCFADNHPLPSTGSVSIRLDSEHPIYAADLLDDGNRPVLPRQAPYEKPVQLLLESSQEADEGAFVDVRVDPPNALMLVPSGDTCQQLAGAFRCTAAEDGTASFIVRSESDWSGTASVQIEGRSEERSFEVKPAGLPADASDFRLIIGGTDQSSDKVPATYSALNCHIGPVPDAAYDKWPAGRIRVRQAVVRATPPPQSPAVVEHAPVWIQSLHSEAELSLDPSCPAFDSAKPNQPRRDTSLRVQLGANNESPPFYLCFSDIGGSAVEVSYYSGELVELPNRVLNVEPEPRLLRVVQLKQTVDMGLQQQPVAEVSAFDANLDPVGMPVDVTSTDTQVLAPTMASMQLSADPNFPSQISIDAIAPGTAVLQVTPRLFESPRCDSGTITIVDPFGV